MFKQLSQSYRQTTYKVLTGQGPVHLRIDQHSKVLDDLLIEHGAQFWAFITAWNPYSQVLTLAENRQRNSILERQIKHMKLHYLPGLGCGDDPSWMPEESWFVFDLSRANAIQLGQLFEQNAVVLGSLKTNAELVWCIDQQKDN